MSIDSIIGKISDKAKAIPAGVWAKVDDINANLDSQAQYKFVCKIAEDEGVSYEDAIAMCTPHSDKWQPKYSMGYKMQSPAITVSLATKKGKEAFKRQLLPEELECFKEIENLKFGELLTEEWKNQKKAEKKAKKEAKKAAKQRAFGLEVKSSKGKE